MMLQTMPQLDPNAGHRTPPAFPHLPEEIWLRIASLLSTKEWAGASGACRALQQLQLERIDIVATSKRLYSCALKWLMRRMGSARSVELDGWPAEAQVQYNPMHQFALAYKAHLNPTVLPRLAVLRAIADRRMLTISADSYGEPRELRQILEQAVNLSTFELVCTKIPLLPTMTSLVHLALKVRSFHMDSERLSPMLQAMPCLQTLQLRQSELEQCHSHTWGDGTLVVPACVQRLELTTFFPESLELLNGGTIVRMTGSLCCMRHALVRWPSVRAQIKGVGMVQSIDADDWGFTEINLDLWGSVEVLQFVEWDHCGLHDLRDVSLANLTVLHMDGTYLGVYIPAFLALKELRFECLNTLCLDFEDAAVTASHVDVFHATFRATCEAGSLTGFCNIMQDRGKGVMVTSSDNGRWKIFTLHYERPETIDGWARLFSGCACEGCVTGFVCFSELDGGSGGSSGFPNGEVMALGVFEESVSKQKAHCWCNPEW